VGTPFLGEIKIISFNFAPKGWAFCNGQLLPINQNQALFSILGTTYGGNGQTTFALPNLQARTPIHFGNAFNLGQAGGESAHTLVMSEMPAHTHFPVASSNVADLNTPVGNFWGKGAQVIYSPTGGSLMKPNATTPVGGSQPHDNQSPYLVLNFIIALSGIFPSRN
jgi:microcystin-dependent protein